MTSIIHYASPLGGMLLAAEDGALTGAWFDGQRFFARGIARFEEVETPELAEARRWLDIYFSGREPDFTPPLRLDGTALAFGDPLRINDHLCGDSKKHRRAKGAFGNVCAGGRRRGREKPRFNNRAVPPRFGRKRQPDRLRRGNAAKGRPAAP